MTSTRSMSLGLRAKRSVSLPIGEVGALEEPKTCLTDFVSCNRPALQQNVSHDKRGTKSRRYVQQEKVQFSDVDERSSTSANDSNAKKLENQLLPEEVDSLIDSLQCSAPLYQEPETSLTQLINR